MLKALGINKKPKAASGTQVGKHEEQQSLRDQWREDAQHMCGILSKLGQSYGAHKGDFALGRYEELKAMIKAAIAEYNALVTETKTRTLGRYTDVEKRYGGEAAAADRRKSSTISTTSTTSSKGLLASLRDNAKAMATHQEVPRTASDMSANEVDEDLTKFRREILQYKQDFKDARDRLEKLSIDYESSKKLSPPQRYNELKNMIKLATRLGLESPKGTTAK